MTWDTRINGGLYAMPKIAAAVPNAKPMALGELGPGMGQPKRRRRRLLNMDMARLVELYAAGHTYDEIADELDVPSYEIGGLINRAIAQGLVESRTKPKLKSEKPVRIRPIIAHVKREWPEATPIVLPHTPRDRRTMTTDEVATLVHLAKNQARRYFASARVKPGVYDEAKVLRLLSGWLGQTLTQLPRLFTTFEAETYLGFKRDTLTSARCQGWGPKYLVVGGKPKGRFLYTKEALDRYQRIRARTRRIANG